MNNQITKPSEFLMAAKAKFGPSMVRWTRGTLNRKGLLTGQNYCSLGAIVEVDQEIDNPNLEHKAMRYLERSMGGNITGFNDWGVRGNAYRSLPMFLWYVVTRLHPGSWLWRKRQVRKAWCNAIDMAVTDELAAEQLKETKDAPIEF